MINHPLIGQLLVAARQQDLLEAAAHHRLAREASAGRWSIDGRPAPARSIRPPTLGIHPVQARCVGR